MQYRFLRVVAYAWWMFARLLIWQVVLKRVAPDLVSRTNLERWTRYARSFRAFAVEMGGVMIKLGQFISTRADILPPEVIAELASLRDEVPGVPSNEIRAIVEREIGPISEHFEWFDDHPVAAASLGQVHRARLCNGDRVVVKVQRPGIDDLCHTDLDALFVVARWARLFPFIRRRADTVALAHEFGRVLFEELSYRHEARNAARFAEMFKDDPGVYIPQVYTDYTTEYVLTLEDVTSIKIDDFAALEAAGIPRKAVAHRLMETYLKQVFEERFFHADPHPGNLFVYPLDPESELGRSPHGGRPFYLIFVDFGMTGSLTPSIQAGLVNTLTAIITRDSHRLIESYKNLGFLLPGADTKRLEDATSAVFEKVWGMDVSEIGNVGYNEIAQIGAEFSDLLFAMPFQMPQDFIYLGRTMSILFGMATALDPTFNPWQELTPYAQKLMARNLSAGHDLGGQLLGGVLSLPFVRDIVTSNSGQALMSVGQSLLGRASTMSYAADVLGRLERGELQLRVEPAEKYARQLARIEANGRRTVRAIIAGSGFITSTLLYTHGDTTAAIVGYAISAVFLLMTLLGTE